ncbi:uncharacterized protein LTR77_007128 [Saxophila tyrrhenica]|uniref:MYND-type domain-containing protein n=1 Tax=Saxophila tyrrhenica TaxID=1690608 RepID=A0AAV9P3Q0_9PEZI|nr:hypothetical protein LTR77_007128 [Saxophila tyrrhenica]
MAPPKPTKGQIMMLKNMVMRDVAVLRWSEGVTDRLCDTGWSSQEIRAYMNGVTGVGILQERQDLIYIRELDDSLGLRELRAKVAEKAGITTNDKRIRLSIFRNSCYGPNTVDITRRFLDSGALRRLVQDDFANNIMNDNFLKNRKHWSGEDAYRFYVFLACVMQLGCVLPDEMKLCCDKMLSPEFAIALKKRYSHYALNGFALAQLLKAYRVYTPGVPADYGGPSFFQQLQTMFEPTWTKPIVEEYGCIKVLRSTMPNGQDVVDIIRNFPDAGKGFESMSYPNHLCAACGADQKSNGEPLRDCSGCGARKYCPRSCQKKHWKLHRFMCTYPRKELESLLDSLPLDFPSAEESLEEAKKNIPDNCMVLDSMGKDIRMEEPSS